MTYDISGWATKYNIKCADNRTILKDAFKECDGEIVPLVWNHQHNSVDNVIGNALLEHRDDGVYTYCSFNDTENGKIAKALVKHGDVTRFSICANSLKEHAHNVLHGMIREVSLVLAGANPQAKIIDVLNHADGDDLNEAIIVCSENFSLYHSDDEKDKDKDETKEQKNTEDETSDDEETIADVFNSMTETQKSAVYFMIGQALDDAGVVNKEDDDDEEIKHDNEGGNIIMHKNLFDQENNIEENVLKHSDEVAIIELAKTRAVGSLQQAIKEYNEQNNVLKHGIDDIETLFPDYKDVYPGAPEFVQRDQGWVTHVMNKVHKSPFTRIRTRQMDIRGEDLRGKGYKKGQQKTNQGNMKLLKRTTDPQTVYVKDKLERDDIVDITDFDVAEYQYKVMRQNLNEEIARAMLIGDGREEGDDNKISQEHIRSIWLDDDLYAIHTDVDIAAAKAELQGTDTGARFGDNYIYAESIVNISLYAREKYKGSGNLDFYCTPHLLNIMLLARDLNGRRIYSSKEDLARALNVNDIIPVEQFEGQSRTVDGKTKNLLGIYVNLNDYQVGATKGGEITNFKDFDIDFNQYKYLIETRCSGALTRVYSAIVLEEPTATVSG